MTDHNTGLKKFRQQKKLSIILLAHHFCGCVPPPKLVILCGIPRPYSLCGVSPQNVGVRNNIILCGFEAASPPKRWHSKCHHSLLFWGGIWPQSVGIRNVPFFAFWGGIWSQSGGIQNVGGIRNAPFLCCFGAVSGQKHWCSKRSYSGFGGGISRYLVIFLVI